MNKQEKTVGQMLQEAREAHGQDIGFVSSALRIRDVHLIALEANDTEALPAQAYAVGFIRTYAGYLGLESDILINLYKNQTDRSAGVDLDFPLMDETRELPSTALVVGLLVVVIVIYLFWAFLITAEEEMIEKASFQEEKIVTQASEEKLQQDISVEADRAIQESDAENRLFNERFSLSSDLDDEVSPISTLPKIDVTALPSLDSTVSDKINSVASVENQRPRVSIRARGETWMRIENADGKILFTSIIRDGERFEFPDGDIFKLATRNAGVLDYVIGDVVIAPVGAYGRVLSRHKIDIPTLSDGFDN